MPNSDSEFIGPVIPTSSKRAIEEDNESSSDEEYGVALPPGFQMNLSNEDKKETSKQRNIGPALPASFPTSQTDDSDSDDEIVGPLPEGVHDNKHNYDGQDRLQANKKEEKREKWMLEPGKALSKTLAQPPKKSVTQFSQKSSKAPQALTEEQRREIISTAKKEEKIHEYIQKYKEEDSKRTMSLMEQHRLNMKNNKKQKTDKDSEDEGSIRRPFDPKKDLNTRTMSERKKNSFVQEASQQFSDRFSRGRFQKFL